MHNHPDQVVAISGASGLVGKALQNALCRDGHTVRTLVRREVKQPEKEIFWDPDNGKIDRHALQDVSVVVNLSGANIAAKPWTDDYKRVIADSRVKSTRLLSETIASLDPKPRVLCNASAIGFYGVRGSEELTEESAAGAGFLADICREWEAATQPAWESGIRVVQMRIGVVLDLAGGALSKMAGPFRLGLGGVIGSGTQYMSWITLPDLVAAIQFIIDNDHLHGAVNCTAPHPATNRQFTHALGKSLGRPTVVPLPSFAARLLAGREQAEEMLLGGANIVPRRLQDAGFQFSQPTIEQALESIFA